MNELLRLSATQQARLIREREISSVELVDAHLRWIGVVNPRINAAIDVLADSALAAARRADESEARGPLHGVPFSIKDSLELAGSVCTAGTVGRRCAAPATEDAVLISRLRAAGAIPIARTNLPDLLFAFESDNLLYGATRNPYDGSRTSGGSSGGEAALIASCGSPLGLGSDAAGSVRLPAAFCGIAGIKPTSGRLDRTGHFPPAGGWIEALWQIGPMARYVEDLQTVMPLLIGEPVRSSPDLGTLRAAFYSGPADAEVEAVVRGAAQSLAGAVARIDEDRPPCLDQAFDLEMKLLGPDGGDGLRQYLCDLGSREVHPLLTAWLDKLERYRTDLAGFAGYWAEWDAYRAAMSAFLRRYDVILCPVYPHAALRHGSSVEDENFRGFAHTMAYNVAGLPAAVVRCGQSADGLPIAVQIVAGPGREDVALGVAAFLEGEFGGWKAPEFAQVFAG
uniref:Amidase n=1 Tax=Solibacter usitatus (strain Ellin6076) TaxID=234267 RepID=Q021B9_SOLUE